MGVVDALERPFINVPLSVRVVRGRVVGYDDWVHKPMRMHLTKDMYNYLMECYSSGYLSYSNLYKWYDLCFEGVRPDWVYRDGVLLKHRSIWRGLRVILSDRPKETEFVDGVCKVVYNKDISGSERYKGSTAMQSVRDEIRAMTETQLKQQLRNIIDVDGNVSLGAGSRRFLRVLLPSSTTELGMRVKMPPDLALACWHAARKRGSSRCSANTLWKLLTTWGIGGQMFSNLVISSTTCRPGSCY